MWKIRLVIVYSIIFVLLLHNESVVGTTATTRTRNSTTTSTSTTNLVPRIFNSDYTTATMSHEVFVVSVTKNVPDAGLIRYHYMSSDAINSTNNNNSNNTHDQASRQGTYNSCCQSILILGVGTTMNVADYDELSKHIVTTTPGTVVIISDSQPGYPFKNSIQKYSNQVVQILQQLSVLITPVCSCCCFDKSTHNDIVSSSSTTTTTTSGCNCNNYPIVVIGGHSAGGMSAFNSITTNLNWYKQNNITIDGFVGLDPFYIKNDNSKKYIDTNNNKTTNERGRRINYLRSFVQQNTTARKQSLPSSTSLSVSLSGLLTIPSLYWGLSKTTCFVNTNNAAQAAYQSSNPKQRIYYQIQNDNSSIDHCCFTNNGCTACTASSSSNREHIWYAVSLSYNAFINVLLLSNNNRRKHKVTTTETISNTNDNDDNNNNNNNNNNDDDNPFDGQRTVFESIRTNYFQIGTKLFYGNDDFAVQ